VKTRVALSIIITKTEKATYHISRDQAFIKLLQPREPASRRQRRVRCAPAALTRDCSILRHLCYITFPDPASDLKEKGTARLSLFRAVGSQTPGAGTITWHYNVKHCPLPSCRYGKSGMASLYYSIEYDAPIEATIFGEKGRIKVHHRAHNPEAITLFTVGASLRGPKI